MIAGWVGTFDPKPDATHDWHIIHDFEETVWRACRSTGLGSMTLVDDGITSFTVTAIRSSRIRRTVRLIGTLLNGEPGLKPLAHITAENSGA